jgi:hypothetical protein
MRKFLALLILLIVPLQLAFAAGAEYCEIGMGDAGLHFGHHDHGAKPHGSPAKGIAGDSDCAYCHLGCSHASISSFEVGLQALAFPAPAEDHPLHCGLPPSTVERPPRTALA